MLYDFFIPFSLCPCDGWLKPSEGSLNKDLVSCGFKQNNFYVREKIPNLHDDIRSLTIFQKTKKRT